MSMSVLLKPLLLLATAVLVACSSTPMDSTVEVAGGGPKGVEQFGRMPLPAGTKLRTADSLIFGTGDNWLGRAMFELPGDANTNYVYFADQFPRQGWTLVTSMRGKKSLQIFTRTDRSIMVEIDDSYLFGNTLATITASPTGSSGVIGNTSASNNGVVVRPVGGARP